MCSTVKNTANLTNDLSNSILQSTTNYCEISCTNQFNGNNLVIDGQVGNFTVSQVCIIKDSSCQIKSTLNSTIDNTINNIIKQVAEADASLGILSPGNKVENKVDLANIIHNSSSQILSSTCVIDSRNTINNNNIVIRNIKCDITYAQSSAVTSSSCVIDNTTDSIVKNTVSNTVDQTAKIQTLFSLIIPVLIVAIIVGGIVTIAVMVGGTVKSVYNSKAKAASINAIAASPTLPEPIVSVGQVKP